MSLPKFKFMDLVFSRRPMFFHGIIRGSFVNDEGKRVYIVRTLQGNYMHAPEEVLSKSGGTLVIPGTTGP